MDDCTLTPIALLIKCFGLKMHLFVIGLREAGKSMELIKGERALSFERMLLCTIPDLPLSTAEN